LSIIQIHLRRRKEMNRLVLVTAIALVLWFSAPVMRRIVKRAMVLAMAMAFMLCMSAASRAGTIVYSNDFEDQLTAGLGGYVSVQPTEGLAAYGLGSYFLHNSTGGHSSGYFGAPGSPTTLTLTNLPEHTTLKLDFLLAVVDSWDGSRDANPDMFHVTIDGQPVFAYYLQNFGGHATQNWPDWQSCILAEGSLLKNSGWSDALYNAGLSAVFNPIAHTGSTVTINWWADGPGWQGGGIYGENDESWGIDNLKVTVESAAVPVPGTVWLLVSGLIGIVGFRKKFKQV
jgi:hypothetical protein